MKDSEYDNSSSTSTLSDIVRQQFFLLSSLLCHSSPHRKKLCNASTSGCGGIILDISILSWLVVSRHAVAYYPKFWCCPCMVTLASLVAVSNDSIDQQETSELVYLTLVQVPTLQPNLCRGQIHVQSVNLPDHVLILF
jgi:hypothetical protein